MDYKRFGNTLVVRIDKGEEIITSIKELTVKEKIKLGSISGLGAVDDINVGVFETSEKKYYSNNFKGLMEIVSLTGTINTMDGEFYCHLHMSVGDRKGNVYGGHLNSAVVSATCEMLVTIIDGEVDREFSNEIGLNLFKFR